MKTTEDNPPTQLNLNDTDYILISKFTNDIITIGGNLYLNKERILEIMEKYNDD